MLWTTHISYSKYIHYLSKQHYNRNSLLQCLKKFLEFLQISDVNCKSQRYCRVEEYSNIFSVLQIIFCNIFWLLSITISQRFLNITNNFFQHLLIVAKSRRIFLALSILRLRNEFKLSISITVHYWSIVVCPTS